MARLYDVYQTPMDRMGGVARRQRLLSRASGTVPEVGLGTGPNLEHYPAGVQFTGIDIFARMLERARERAARLGREVRLELADVEALPFQDASFDTATATCVFCSVENPVQGLRDVRRVVKPQGRVLLLEHVRPTNWVLGKLFDLLSPLTRRLFGPAINRHTEANVRAAGLSITSIRRHGIWREIEARAAATTLRSSTNFSVAPSRNNRTPRSQGSAGYEPLESAKRSIGEALRRAPD